MQAYLSGFALSIFIKIKWSLWKNHLLGEIGNSPIMAQHYPSFYLNIYIYIYIYIYIFAV